MFFVIDNLINFLLPDKCCLEITEEKPRPLCRILD